MGETANGFLDYLKVEAGLAENTLMGYGRDLAEFCVYCQQRQVDRPAGLTPELLYAYISTMGKARKAESSIHRAIVAVKMLCRFAVMTGTMTDDLAGLLESPKLWQRLPIVCHKEKVLALLMAPQPQEPYYYRDKAILELLYATGCRVSEEAGLRVGDLNLAVGYVRCFGKGSKERVVPLGRTAAAAVQGVSGAIAAQVGQADIRELAVPDPNGQADRPDGRVADRQEICPPGGDAGQVDGAYPAALFCDAPLERRGGPAERAGDAGACGYPHDADLYPCRSGSAPGNPQEISPQRVINCHKSFICRCLRPHRDANRRI